MTETYDRLHEIGRLLDGEGYGTEADVVYEAAEAIKTLKAENEGLRELVGTLWSDILAFDTTPYYTLDLSDDSDRAKVNWDWSWKDARLDTMRDLGIEVDGCL